MWLSRQSTHAGTTESGGMRACVIEQPGADGYLRQAQLPVPAIAADEVLVRVSHAGVNRADLLQKRGQYNAPEGDSPILGLEVSGIIAQVGAQVIGWSVDEPVVALTNGGGYAEYVAVPASQVLALPRRLSPAQGASLPEALATAAMALLMEAQLTRGDRVLIHGGASGVGVMMVQIARALGGTVFATASSHEKHDLIRRMGATPLSYDTEGFADSARAAMGGKGVNVIVDTLGGPYIAHHMKLLEARGRMVSIAVLEGSKATVSAASVLMKHITWSGATLRNRTRPEKAAIMELVRKQLWPLVASGMVEPVVDSVFPLEDAEKAHERMENRLNSGKIVLEVLLETKA